MSVNKIILFIKMLCKHVVNNFIIRKLAIKVVTSLFAELPTT